MAGAYLEILQGDDYTFSTNVALDGVAQNIAGASLWFVAVGDPDQTDDDPTEIINVSTGSGQIAISGNNSNVITITMNAAFTENITQVNVARWALKCETAGGLNYTLDRGRCAVLTPIVPP